MTNTLISATGITKTYGNGETQVTALNKVDFSAEADEFVAIMGRSGCGKTTLISVLSTMNEPDSGEYYLGGTLVSSLNEKQMAKLRRKQISVIYQNYNLVEEITVRDNIVLPYVFDRSKYDRAEFDKIAAELGLSDKLHKYPAQLSGGEKQRVAIARALLQGPSVILADEPTGNLDYQSAVDVVSTLRSCAKEHHQTVIMVTHDREMAGYADRIVNMKDGNIVDEK
jgi:putative ABC transport system ATP-binding protein